MSGYNHQAARRPDQANRMKDLADRGICAFCPEHIHTETTSRIAIETDDWYVKDNDYPYEGARLHLLLIPKAHVTDITELPTSAQTSFLPLIAQIKKKYKLISYFVGIRSGDFNYNGGSVEHLHAHLIVGDTDNPDHEPVRFKVSSRPKH